MIFLNDSIHYERVLSKDYQFYYKDMEQKTNAFFEEVNTLGVQVNGPFFYTLNNVPNQEIMNARFFIPVREEPSTSGEMQFHSYYSVEQMMSMRILNQVDQGVEAAYSAMLQFMQTEGLEQTTPPFHIVDKVGKQYFITVKVGYALVET